MPSSGQAGLVRQLGYELAAKIQVGFAEISNSINELEIQIGFELAEIWLFIKFKMAARIEDDLQKYFQLLILSLSLKFEANRI